MIQVTGFKPAGSSTTGFKHGASGADPDQVTAHSSAKVNLAPNRSDQLAAADVRLLELAHRVARWRWIVVPILAAIMAAYRSEAFVSSIDLHLFDTLGRAVLAGHLSAAYASPINQGGPLQLIAAAIVPLSAFHSGTIIALNISSGVVIAIASMWLIRCLRRSFALPSSAPHELTAGLITAAWIVGGYGVRCHLAELTVPVAWMFAGVAARRGRWAQAGILLGLATGFEAWGLLGIPIALLADQSSRAIRSAAIMIATAALIYLPFLLSGPFEQPKYRWPIFNGTLVHLLWPHATTFGWAPRLLQGALCLGIGCIMTVALRHRAGAIWLVPLTILLTRLLLDPVQIGYYWVAPQITLIAGMVFLRAANHARIAIIIALVGICSVSGDLGSWTTGITAFTLAATLGLAVVERRSGAIPADDYQPRVASLWSTGTSSTLMPTIASPSPRETLAITSGSS